MTRVLFWCEAFPPYIGGVEVLAASFVRHLRGCGYELLVITRKDEDGPPDESEYYDVPIYRFPFWTALASRDVEQMSRISRRVAELKKAFRPDITHINFFQFGVLFHRQTAAVSPAPVLVTLHGTHPDRFYGSDTLFGPLLRSADWVVACSSAVLCETRRQLPELAPRSSVVHSTLEPPTLLPTPLSLDPPCLLCAGRLSQEKGFDLAIRGFATLAGRFPTVRLVIAGDGPERIPLEGLAAELGVGDRVDFLGWVAPQQMPALLNRATVALVPSRSESLGLSALQAAQMARPVVATRVGGLPEVVADGETGLLLEPEDSQALAEAAAVLLAQPAMAAQMGQRAQERSRVVFDWERHVGAYRALYQRLGTVPVG